MEKTKTLRGFALIKFKDKYEAECSIQKSSSVEYDAVWIGVDETGEI